MIAFKTAPSLGLGIYRISDVHRYAEIPYSTVYSWFKSRDLLDSDYVKVGVEAHDYSVSFLDLIDACVARRFYDYGVKMRVVRKAYQELGIVLNTAHPFCHRSLYTDGKTVVFRAASQLKTKNLHEAISKQQLFDEMQGMLENVAYSENDLAKWWDIAPGVVLNPRIAMGQPTIKGTGVTTYVVKGSYYANKQNAGLVASLFGISPGQVKHAVEFEDRHAA